MRGIDEGYDLPREAEDDMWSLTERERKSLGIEPLPKSLYDAINIAENSELLAETLGEHVFDFFLRNKRSEWEDYRVPGVRPRAGPDAPASYDLRSAEAGALRSSAPRRARSCATSLFSLASSAEAYLVAVVARSRFAYGNSGSVGSPSACPRSP